MNLCSDKSWIVRSDSRDWIPTCTRIGHDIAVITQTFYPFHEHRTCSLQRCYCFKLFLLFLQACQCCWVGRLVQGMRCTRGSDGLPHDRSWGWSATLSASCGDVCHFSNGAMGDLLIWDCRDRILGSHSKRYRPSLIIRILDVLSELFIIY